MNITYRAKTTEDKLIQGVAVINDILLFDFEPEYTMEANERNYDYIKIDTIQVSFNNGDTWNTVNQVWECLKEHDNTFEKKEG